MHRVFFVLIIFLLNHDQLKSEKPKAMIRRIHIGLVLGLFLSIGMTSILAQETKNSRSHYNVQLNIDPYTFDVNKLSEIDLSDLRNQAFIYMLEKDFESAASVYLAIVNFSIEDAESYYYLAKCYAFLGEEHYASDFLILAVNHGFNNYSLIKEEKAFQLLLNRPTFSRSYQAILDAVQHMGSSIYVKAEKLIKCRIFLPENYDAEKAYPLLIGMHGYGGSSEEFSQLWKIPKSHSFIFVVPEAPYTSSPDDYDRNAGYSWSMRVQDVELFKRSDHLSSDFILNVKEYISQQYRIGKSYLMGFSQGGSYTYVTGIKNPNDFDGIICFGSRLPDTQKYPWFLSDEDLEKGSGLKVFIAHGKDDSPKHSNQAKRTLKKYNYQVEHYLFEGGHKVDHAAFLKALEWMGIQ